MDKSRAREYIRHRPSIGPIAVVLVIYVIVWWRIKSHRIFVRAHYLLCLGSGMIESSPTEWYGSKYPMRNRRNAIDISVIHYTTRWKRCTIFSASHFKPSMHILSCRLPGLASFSSKDLHSLRGFRTWLGLSASWQQWANTNHKCYACSGSPICRCVNSMGLVHQRRDWMQRHGG